MRSCWRKSRKYITVMSLLVTIMLGCVTDVQAATTFSSITSESIRQKESQISEAQSQREQLNNSLTDVKKVKEELESVKNDLKNYVSTLDANLNDIQEKIAELQELIATKEKEIEETEKQLEEAKEVELAQYEAMKARIQFMYEKGDGYYLEMLLNSDSFSDMLNKADYVEMLSEYDSRMLDEYVQNRQLIEMCKENLDAQKEVLDEAKVNVESEETALNNLISEKETQITAYESDISNKKAAIQEYESEIAEQNEIISQLEAAVAAERKKIAAESGYKLSYDGGMFSWPAPSYTKISDDYGNRIHPILGVQQFHNGVDMAAPSGSPILAAYAGQVVAASYSGSMGNYIMIDHGDSMYTIYMHASALYVAQGDLVTKGQQIGAVGSTGRSTGPHLHFSVRLNGGYVSPWSYFK